MGAVAVMILGTVGERTPDHPSFFPFYQALAEEDLTLAVHVGWSCPPLSNMYDPLYPGTIISFLVPLLMGFTAMITGGVPDRFAVRAFRERQDLAESAREKLLDANPEPLYGI